MKRFLTAMISVVALCFMSRVFAEEKPILKLTYGYFQIREGGWPINLQETTKVGSASREDEMRIWIKLDAVSPSPCSEQSETPCIKSWQLKSGDKLVYEIFKRDIRWDWDKNPKDESANRSSISVGFTKLPRKINSGPASWSYVITKDEKVIYALKIEFEVR